MYIYIKYTYISPSSPFCIWHIVGIPPTTTTIIKGGSMTFLLLTVQSHLLCVRGK